MLNIFLNPDLVVSPFISVSDLLVFFSSEVIFKVKHPADLFCHFAQNHSSYIFNSRHTYKNYVPKILCIQIACSSLNNKECSKRSSFSTYKELKLYKKYITKQTAKTDLTIKPIHIKYTQHTCAFYQHFEYTKYDRRSFENGSTEENNPHATHSFKVLQMLVLL